MDTNTKILNNNHHFIQRVWYPVGFHTPAQVPPPLPHIHTLKYSLLSQIGYALYYILSHCNGIRPPS